MPATLGAPGAQLTAPAREAARIGRGAVAPVPPLAQRPALGLAANARGAGVCVAALGPGGSQFFSDEDPNAPVKRVIKDTADRPDLLDDRTTPIWTVDWQEQMDAKAERERKLRERGEAGEEYGANDQSGFLSINRVGQLDRMDLDVGELIRKAPEERSAAEAVVSSSGSRVPQASLMSTSWAEVRPKVLVDEVMKKELSPEEVAAMKAREEARYAQLCSELYLVTGGSVGVGAVSGLATAGAEAGVSFLLGGLGALLYVRSLITQVNGMTGQGGGMGPPRLAIPVILAMGFNRYNTLLAPDTGFELSFFPILLGFLTYKIATSFQIFRSLQLANEDEAWLEEGGTVDTMMRELEKS